MWLREVPPPRRVEPSVGIALQGLVPEAHRVRSHVEGTKAGRQPPGIDGLPMQVAPRRLLEGAQAVDEVRGRQPVDTELVEHRPNVRQQAHPERGSPAIPMTDGMPGATKRPPTPSRDRTTSGATSDARSLGPRPPYPRLPIREHREDADARRADDPR